MAPEDSKGLETETKDATAAEKKRSAAVFRARRRPRKVRKREEVSEGEEKLEKVDGIENQVDADEAAELSREELVLLREAQQLRERARTSTFQTNKKEPGNVGVSDHNVQNEPSGIDEGLHGLSSQFSAERGGLAIQERMDKFIQSGLRKKFGHLCDEAAKEKPNVEDLEVFEIPKQLQVEERLLYDPSEGMPSAGLEEVEIPVVVSEIGKTTKRPDVLRKESNRETAEAQTLGNLSSNFLYHRLKWNEANNKPLTSTDKCVPEKVIAGEQGGGTMAESKESEKGKQSAGKRSRHAVDAAFADRWKKRWRR